MFGLFPRRTTSRFRKAAACRLQLESLDDRIVPAAPAISSIDGRIIGSTIVIQGTVHDDAPGTDTVTATGGVSGTYHTDLTGHFEFVGTFTGNGSVTINVHNDAGLDSDPYPLFMSPGTGNQPPVILDVTCQEIGPQTFTLRGRVIDEFAQGLTVNIGGEIDAFRGQSVTVGADGWFELTVQTNQTVSGIITVDVTDWWGASAQQGSVLFTGSN